MPYYEIALHTDAPRRINQSDNELIYRGYRRQIALFELRENGILFNSEKIEFAQYDNYTPATVTHISIGLEGKIFHCGRFRQPLQLCQFIAPMFLERNISVTFLCQFTESEIESVTNYSEMVLIQ